MKKIAFSAILATSLFAAPAFAADLGVISAPQETVVSDTTAFDWTGFYAGVNAGYGWGEVESSIVGVAGTDDIEGWLGGAQAGYNYDFGGFVLGIEGDVQFSDVSYSEDLGFGVTSEESLQYFGTVRARAGVAFDRFMPYVTGGVAFGRGKLELSGPGASFSDEQNHVGWTVGGGLEYAVTDNISVKGEYLYTDLGDQTYTILGTSADASVTFSTVRAGVNFKF